MAKNILLISVEEIKARSPIQIAVDDKTLKSLVVNTQEIYLTEIITNTLYDTITESVYELRVNGTPISDDTKAFLIVIKNYLLYQVIVDFITVSSANITNKGVIRLNDDNATLLTIDELEYYSTRYKNILSGYKKKLVDYIKDNN